MKKGDIWTIDLPSSQFSEQMGTRPSVIIANVDADIAIIIPFTTNKQALRYKNTMLIESNSENGLNQDSVLLVFQIRAIDKNRIKNKIGEIDKQSQSLLDTMIKKMLTL